MPRHTLLALAVAAFASSPAAFARDITHAMGGTERIYALPSTR